MGYTHYWYADKKNIDSQQYAAALKDIAKIVTNQKAILAGPNGDGKPSMRSTIAFNGIGGDSHESFILPSLPSNFEPFDFCKTAQKPYDIVVVACLARLAEVPGFRIESDGSAEELKDGTALASKILGRPIANPKGQKLKLVKSFFEKVRTGYEMVKAEFTIKDQKAAKECVQYILDTEADDYYEQAQEYGVTKKNWKKKWHKVKHIFVAALKATGQTPDVDSFDE